MKLLIIEDDPDQRDLIRQTLEAHFGPGTVDGAATIADALRANVDAFDLILSDYNLPDGTGLDLLERMRHAEIGTPVILVTGENVGRTAVEAIRRGAMDYVVKFGEYLFTIPLVVEKNLTAAKVERENKRLRQDLERAYEEVHQKNLQLEESLHRLELAAATDPLTGLYNRRHFGMVIEQLFAEAQRYGNDLSCVMIDLDGYKQLNDSLGHQMGDQLLTVAAKAITSNLRKMDVAARYGGDEFVLLLPRAGTDEAAGVAARVREDFGRATAAVLRRNNGLTMSVGIGSLMGDGVAATEQLVARADAALYRAKADGRNRVVVSHPVRVTPAA
ncbi:MAG TPA: diguanylate cyclase [Tepidisphaeraceae bacterium]